MAGRGRGRGGLKATLLGQSSAGQLRKPGENTPKITVKDTPKEPPKRDLADELSNKIKTLALEPKPADLDELQRISKEYSTDRKKIEEIAQIIYDRCLGDAEFSVTGADLCQKLTEIEADQVKFRSCILKLIQRDFKEKENIQKESKSKFICFTSILCQLFGHIKINDVPMVPLVVPVFDCLDMLLEGGGDEIESFNMQIQSIGILLEKYNPARMKNTLQTLRTKVISSSSSARQRCLLLEVLELQGRGWRDHDPEVARFYTDLLMDLQATEVLE
ncbi:MIF4G domain-containing protein B-like [Lineus longissimus]|uniref:MIF4G domain-containing protein B-like n=1 Tax=Lineus longissimus TaxID=88925 RepID=UPI002B4DF35A